MPGDELVDVATPSVLENGQPIPMPKDPELRVMVDSIVDHAVLALERVAAAAVGSDVATAPAEPDGFELAAAAFVDRLKPNQRTEVGERSIDALRNRRAAGDKRDTAFARVDLRAASNLTVQLDAAGSAESGTQPTGPGRTRQRQSRQQARRLLASVERLVSPVDLDVPARVAPQSGRPLPPPRPVKNVTIGSVGAALAQGMKPDPKLKGLSPIETKYQQLGGPGGPLGPRQGGEVFMKDALERRFRVQFYGSNGVSGAIFFGPGVEAFGIWGPIFHKYQELAGVDSPFLGIPVRDQGKTADGVGDFCHFMLGGSIYNSPQFGAHEVHGAIRQTWADLFWEAGVLGHPKTDEGPTREPQPPIGRLSRTSAFHHGAIYWTPRYGAKALKDAFVAPYEQVGEMSGNLGAPIWDGVTSHPVVLFEGGDIRLKDGKAEIHSPVKAVSISIKRVICNEPTEHEFGKDEINYSGVLVPPSGIPQSTGRIDLGKYAKGHVAENFGSKTVQTASVDIDAVPAQPWPRCWTFIGSFAEVDKGNVFDDYILKLTDAVEGWIAKKLKEAGAALGGAAGAINPLLGFLVRTVLSELLPALINKLAERIKKLFKDYVFPPLVSRLCVEYVHQLPVTPFKDLEREYTITGHGAKYTISLQWNWSKA